MRYLLFFTLISCTMPATDAQNPADHTWKHRILLIFSPSQQTAEYREQLDQLRADPSGLQERDLQVYRIFPEGLITSERDVLDHNDLSDQYRSQYGVDPETFTVILVGKDGTEKLRTNQVLRTDKLYAAIDAMPMRRRELREKGQ